MSHEDRVFFGNFIGVLAVLVMMGVIFFFLADTVTRDMGHTTEVDALIQAKTAENIKPVGEVNIGTVPAGVAAAPAAAAPATAAGPRSGEDVYNAHCAACHATGVAGAPKHGDKAAWAPRVAQGMDTLLLHATNGLNMMPPKGTCVECSEEELKGAIEYLLSDQGT